MHEWLEDALELISLDAESIVHDFDHDLGVLGVLQRCADRDVAPFRGKLGCIGEQIGHDLRKANRVDQHLEPRREMECQAVPLGLEQRARDFNRSLDG